MKQWRGLTGRTVKLTLAYCDPAILDDVRDRAVDGETLGETFACLPDVRLPVVRAAALHQGV